MSLKIDIAAKLVSPTQQAWVIHAGKSQSSFNDFSRKDIAFLEAPYLALDDKILSVCPATY
ncbi:hypothetical protein FV222_00800 [Methylobacterium sp. WL103]|uniref:hypothetical protein n=1 Tax=Methylobacterium sp. WL103 TaxID=2603891 RepID=UPI0011CBA3AE|nr:hypothetical protein [Methylobacterium sp. WL103]TXN08572.1 hypothetical protein FV222_00800 [Methylobacterium sp. WL103]